jgi:NADH-quinone oxidoreductase subunit L
MNTTNVLLILLLPFVSFLVLGLAGKKLFGNKAGLVGTLLMFVSFILAVGVAADYFGNKTGDAYQQVVPFKYTWLSFANGLKIEMGALIDPVAVMMLLVVTFISLMVHVFSLAYMKGEDRFHIYYAFLGLFTFSMLGLVLSSNIFQIYIFWELVGVSSFLLIGFYYQKNSALAAAKKAFIVTRFADLGFLIGILVLSSQAGTLDFQELITRLTTPGEYLTSATVAKFMGFSALSWGLILVFMGAAGKSAMFPLHIWLPDAMEGPTPVSALIHAATMVVAGVFLIARMYPVYIGSGSSVINVIDDIGAFTALFAAIIACTQTDIKRVLAYSTISQIGFMMFSLGVTGPDSHGYTASMFHLFTHAIFKALLFLAAGVVIHFVHSNEMKDMGGLAKKMPVTHLVFLAACLAISGIPPFAGFFSKEEILMNAWENNRPIFWIAILTSGLTAFYMFRLYFSIFWNKPYDDHGHHHKEGSMAELIPLSILGVGTVVAGFVPFGKFVTLSGKALPTELHLQFSIGPVAMALLGILLAAWMYKSASSKPEKTAAGFGVFYKAAQHKFYIDEIWMAFTKSVLFNLIAKPAAWVDRNVIDGMVKGTGTATQWASERIKGLQSGRVQQYGLVFLFGIIIIVSIFLLRAQGV